MLSAQTTTLPAIAAALVALALMIVLAITSSAGLFVANIFTI